jgi:hypothetical protein
MSVISFDIGIKNLAVIHLVRDDAAEAAPRLEIVDWDVLNLVPDGQKVKSQSLDETTRTLYTMLEQRWQTGTWQSEAVRGKELVILIENQPAMKNPIMKSIQMLVYGFFAYKQVVTGVPLSIRLMSATCKLKLGKDLPLECNTKSKSTYIQNKKKAVAYTDHFLKLVCKNPDAWAGVLTDRKKKDDVADCFLQALYFFQSPEAGALHVDGIVEPAKEEPKKKKDKKKKGVVDPVLVTPAKAVAAVPQPQPPPEAGAEANAMTPPPKAAPTSTAKGKATGKAKGKGKGKGKAKYNNRGEERVSYST